MNDEINAVEEVAADAGFNFFGEASGLKKNGAALHLKSIRTGEPMYFGPADDRKPITITLLSKDSDEFMRAQRAITNRRLNSRGGSTLTAERLDSEAAESLARVTIAWQGIVGEDGKPLDCNFHNAKRLYEQVRDVREQVDAFVAERSNFLSA